MIRSVAALALVAGLSGCAAADGPAEQTTDAAPERFTIVPDDYHVPYAGTAGDGRRFFLSEELFAGGSSYVGVFLWKADGTFDELRVDDIASPDEVDGRVATRLAELGDYELEPIEVEPFTEVVDGVTFGWRAGRYEDGTHFVNIEPGDFIAYYAPWDGVEYDT